MTRNSFFGNHNIYDRITLPDRKTRIEEGAGTCKTK